MLGKIGKAFGGVSKLMQNPIVKAGLMGMSGGALNPATLSMASSLLGGGGSGAGSMLGGQLLGGLNLG